MSIGKIPVMDGCETSSDAPCLALLRAAFANLMADLAGNGKVSQGSVEGLKRRRTLQLEARSYIRDTSNEAWSFNWLCEHLDVDAEWFRLQLKRGKRVIYERKVGARCIAQNYKLA